MSDDALEQALEERGLSHDIFFPTQSSGPDELEGLTGLAEVNFAEMFTSDAGTSMPDLELDSSMPGGFLAASGTNNEAEDIVAQGGFVKRQIAKQKNRAVNFGKRRIADVVAVSFLAGDDEDSQSLYQSATYGQQGLSYGHSLINRLGAGAGPETSAATAGSADAAYGAADTLAMAEATDGAIAIEGAATTASTMEATSTVAAASSASGSATAAASGTASGATSAGLGAVLGVGALVVAIIAVLAVVAIILIGIVGAANGQQNAGSLTGNEAIVANYLMSHGFDALHTAAIMGNLKQESGMDPTDTNSIGATGIVQWYQGRAQGLRDYAASQGKPFSDIYIQLDYMLAEITGTGSAAPYASREMDFASFNALTDLDAATAYVFYNYERPGDSSLPTRQGYAQDYYAQLTGASNGVVALALAQVGKPYVWGAAGPDTFDCSGLVCWTYNQVYGITLPHNSAAQYNATQRITAAELQPGDLIFWGSDPTDPSTIEHVAIYIGSNQLVQAADPAEGVNEVPLYQSFQNNGVLEVIVGYGRVTVQ
ncbi:MAG: phage tail tip lysozyme [Coriobacteriia bacterium]|nr:phage tail tip lysozyme [Coriobacteriia bacterium]